MTNDLEMYNVIPGLEFLADNPDFLTSKNHPLLQRCSSIHIPKAYIAKLIVLQNDHPDDERYLDLLKVLADLLQSCSHCIVRHPSNRPILIEDAPTEIPELLAMDFDKWWHEYHTISLALHIQEESHKVPTDSAANCAAILTDDEGLRAFAYTAGIKVLREKRQTYTGRRCVSIDDDLVELVSDPSGLTLSEWHELFPDQPDLHPNEFVEFKTDYYTLNLALRYHAEEHKLMPPLWIDRRAPLLASIFPKNNAQTMLYDALLAPVSDIPIVIAQGPQGTGKTFLATAVALAGVRSQTYQEISICPRDSKLGDDIGAVPGNTFEKCLVKARGVVDNLREALRLTICQDRPQQLHSTLESYLNSYCDFVPLVEIGGRSIAKSFIICDEFQDMTRQQARSAMTRSSLGSKLVVLGDLAQINNPKLTPTSCGLAYAIKRLAGKSKIAFVSFTPEETVRPDAATILAQYL